jgi:hypothetical protein
VSYRRCGVDLVVSGDVAKAAAPLLTER